MSYTPPSFRVAYSTVADGNMSVKWGPEDEVVGNRKRFLEKHGLRLEDTVILDLAHDAVIAHVTRSDAGTYVRAEASITNERGLSLMLLTADCAPVSLYDPVRNVIALAHLSWQTATLHLAEKTVHEMRVRYGTDPKDILVSIGPAGGKDSYIQTEVKQKDNPEWQQFLKRVESGVSIDVSGFIVSQLVHAQVPINNIDSRQVDTITSPHYFSHYRSVRTGEQEGRFATVAVLE